MQAPKRVGIYGGTFDPIHWGHINLALEIKEKRQLDAVWFCPAKINPLKEKTAATPEQRLKMLQLALAQISDVDILDIELKREGPSYTIDTLNYLMEKHREIHFAWIIGEDAMHNFFQWKRAEDIASLVSVFVGSRGSQTIPQGVRGNTGICQALLSGWTPTRVMEISATEIRHRLQQRLYCGHLVPKECLDYIYKNQLYFTPP